MNKHTAELLEKHFDAAFAAPDGIKKLRELILTLAMQGKLIPQGPNAQPASELLKKIETEKQRLVKEGKIKKPRPLLPVTDEEKPYVLPQGWEWVRLGTVVLTTTGGGTPSKNNPAFWGGDIPWASVKDLNVEIYLESTIDSITDAAVAASSTNVIPKGQIIVCTRMGLGKIAINSIDTAINQDLKALSISANIDQMYFFNKYKGYKIVGSGMTVQGIRQEDLLNYLFPLPPFEEQKRIVAKIDELMACCDELEKLRIAQKGARLTVHAAAIKQLLNIAKPDQHQRAQAFLAGHFGELYTVKENVAELRKAILQLAVMGKLVPQNPDDQPASELLKEIEVEKQRLVKEGKIKKPKPLPPVTEEEKPYVLPQGWEWARFDSLINQEFPIGYGVLVPGPDVDGGVPFVRIEDLDIKAPRAQPSKRISKTIAKNFERTKLVGGEILMGVVGSIGKLGVAPKEWAGSYIARAVCRIVPTLRVNKAYILWILQSAFMQMNFRGETRTLAQPTLNIGLIRNSLTPLPPLAEQQRIVTQIDQLMVLCDSLDKQIDAATGKQVEMLSALMHTQVQENTEGELKPASPSTAQVIDLATYRAAIGCYAISKLATAQYFGRTAAAKVMYLAQAHIGLALDLKPEREAAGPLDTWIYDFERKGQDKRWFEINEKTLANGRKKTEYRCLSGLSEPAAKAEALMLPGQRAEFDRLIYALADKTTEEVEILATLFAVWNDFLIDGVQPTDAQIISDVRENWHERKARFTPAELGRWLDWLRRENITPRGLPPRTVQQSRLGLD